MTDPVPEGCIVCGAGPVEKILFPVAVHFKGSGFYSTDYGRGGRKPKDGEAAPSDTGKDKPAADKAPAAEKKTTPPASD